VTRECHARFYERRRVKLPPPTHHRYKHESGAKLEQIRPGVYRWTTPLGHTYIVEPDPDDP
jgi:hypothetical protein